MTNDNTCPTWCTAEHTATEYADAVEGDRLLHRREFDDLAGVPARVLIEEDAASELAVTVLAPDAQLTAAGARRLAVVLMDAASRIEARAD